MAVVVIANNAVNAKLIDAPKEIKVMVSEWLSYTIDGAEHMTRFKNGNWSGKSSFFDMRSSSFPAGFISPVIKRLKKNGYQVHRVCKPLPTPLGHEKPNIDTFGHNDKRYDYQLETVDRLTKAGAMISQIATGGGKSRVCNLAVARINRPALFITTRGVLMYQMKKAFDAALKYRAAHGEPHLKGKVCGVIGDGEWSPQEYINVAMVQTLRAALEDKTYRNEISKYEASRLTTEMKRLNNYVDALKAAGTYTDKQIDLKAKIYNKSLEKERLNSKEIALMVKRKTDEHNLRRQRLLEFLSLQEFIILEEAHEASGNSYYDLLKLCRNAHYRLALTATPFMKEDCEANMRLMASVGPIGIRVTEAQLIESGILAKPYFRYVDTPKPKKLYKTTPWKKAYRIGVVENEFRNSAIIAEATRFAKHGLTTIILIGHKVHGDLLCKRMKAVGLRCKYIFGDSNQDEREFALSQLGSGKLDVLIGSTICDVGVDVPSVGAVILAGAGKAEVALRQRIGRGLRAKKSGANIAFIVDFVDSGNDYLAFHAKQRKAIVENTPGFAENIVKDFDFSLLKK